MAFGWNVPGCSYFDEKDVKVLIDSGLRILEKSVWTIDGTDEFMEHLRDFGCELDGKKVKFPKKIIDESMRRIKKIKNENEKDKNTEDKHASKTITYSTSGQAIHCCDPETAKLRPATKKDQEDLSRVINSYEGLGRGHPTFIPQDAPLMTRDLHAFVTIMLNSDKPYRVSSFSPEIVKYFIEALTIYYGSKEKAIDNLLLPCKVWINTPFMISRESIKSAMVIRKLTGKPLTYNPMPVAGIATPVTPSGALALITAEVLGVNVISLAIDDCLCKWCAAPLSFDMKNAIDNLWGPEVLTIATAQTHLSSYLFGGMPSVRPMTYTRAKVPGVQSIAERSFGIGMGFMAGHRSFGALATLANADVGSIVQLVLDMEIIEAVKKMVEGFDVIQEEMDEDFIVETASKGANFLDTDNTAHYFRKYQWFPELMDRQVPMAWVKNPTNMLEKAREKALDLIKTAPNKCPLEEGQKKELQQLLNTADKELG